MRWRFGGGDDDNVDNGEDADDFNDLAFAFDFDDDEDDEDDEDNEDEEAKFEGDGTNDFGEHAEAPSSPLAAFLAVPFFGDSRA